MFGLPVTSGFHRSSWSNEFTGEIQIMASLLFFGASFIGQRYAMLQGMGPISYNACRYIFSTFFLCIAKYGLGLAADYEEEEKKDKLRISIYNVEESEDSKRDISQKDCCSNDLLIYGLGLGVANFAGSLLQQIGLVTVTAGKTGFITGMYVVIVPIVEYLTPGFNSSLSIRAWIAAGLSFFGLFLLSGCAGHEVCFGGAIKMGEATVFVSMLFWVVSIMMSDVGSKKVEVVLLTLVDFLTTTVITLLLALYMEPEAWVYPYTSIQRNIVSIIAVGFSEAVAFTLSTLGQMYTPPSRAALLFSLEAVVCAFLSYIFLNETLRPLETCGGFLMFSAALVSSWSFGSEEEEDDGRTTDLQATAEEGRPLLRAQ
ncbi:DMT family transporter [archaeon]|nr:MAG: DMT family transporter [archaeon]